MGWIAWLGLLLRELWDRWSDAGPWSEVERKFWAVPTEAWWTVGGIIVALAIYGVIIDGRR